MAAEAQQSNEFKRLAAERAVEFVASGMVVGLGHGTTSAFAIARLGELLRTGSLSRITGIPCSKQTEAGARQAGIPVRTLDAHPSIDIVIDGADEVDPKLNMIKGGGGALLREKVVAEASKRRGDIVGETKIVPAPAPPPGGPRGGDPFCGKSSLPLPPIPQDSTGLAHEERRLALPDRSGKCDHRL